MAITQMQGFWISFVLIFLNVEGQQQPEIGDIRLEKYKNLEYYEALIYYGDGIHPPEWGGICALNPGVSVKTAEVFCKHLGYKPMVESPTSSRDTGRPVWLKDVECESNIYSHILRCGHTVVTGDERNNSMSCGSLRERLLIRCDITHLDTYDGEIRLCPPDNTHYDTNNKTSISFGVVALSNFSEWRGIFFKTLLGNHEADTICRQLGYTNAIVGSAVAESATQFTFEQCYDLESGWWGFSMKRNAWMTTGYVKCNHTQSCFACCHGQLPDKDCTGLKCDDKRDIVIGCTFDPGKVIDKSLEPQQQCNVSKNSLQCNAEVPSHSTGSNSSESDGLKGGLILFAILFFCSLSINIAIAVKYIIWRKEQAHYDNI